MYKSRSKKITPMRVEANKFFMSALASSNSSTRFWCSALTVYNSSLTLCNSSLVDCNSSFEATISSLLACSSSLLVSNCSIVRYKLACVSFRSRSSDWMRDDASSSASRLNREGAGWTSRLSTDSNWIKNAMLSNSSTRNVRTIKLTNRSSWPGCGKPSNLTTDRSCSAWRANADNGLRIGSGTRSKMLLEGRPVGNFKNGCDPSKACSSSNRWLQTTLGGIMAASSVS